MGSDCANRIDQWQELGFEERLKTADRELELAAKTGYNSIRIVLEFIVWKEEHDGFMNRLEEYIKTADKHGISCMIVFGNDCMLPKQRAGNRRSSVFNHTIGDITAEESFLSTEHLMFPAIICLMSRSLPKSIING